MAAPRPFPPFPVLPSPLSAAIFPMGRIWGFLGGSLRALSRGAAAILASPHFPPFQAFILGLLLLLAPLYRARAPPHSLLASPHNLLEARLVSSAGGWTSLLFASLLVASSPLTRPSPAAILRLLCRWGVGVAFHRSAPFFSRHLEAATGSCWSDALGGLLLLPDRREPISCRGEGRRWEGFRPSPQAFALVHCGLGLAEEVGALGRSLWKGRKAKKPPPDWTGWGGRPGRSDWRVWEGIPGNLGGIGQNRGGRDPENFGGAGRRSRWLMGAPGSFPAPPGDFPGFLGGWERFPGAPSHPEGFWGHRGARRGWERPQSWFRAQPLGFGSPRSPQRLRWDTEPQEEFPGSVLGENPWNSGPPQSDSGPSRFRFFPFFPQGAPPRSSSPLIGSPPPSAFAPPPFLPPDWPTGDEVTEEPPKNPGTALAVLHLLNVALIFLWTFLLLVTFSYRQDWSQNAAGAAMAWGVWVLTYRLWYRSAWSPGPPGLEVLEE